MSDEPKTCPGCGGNYFLIKEVYGNLGVGSLCISECDSCGRFEPFKYRRGMDRYEEATKAWNTRPDSKPYKYETEDDWQESCGWFTSEFQEAITLAFAAARVHKEG